METAFHQKYLDQGLYTVALDPDDGDAEDVGGLSEYVSYLEVSYPVGIETNATYDQIEGIHDGGNPFPVDVIIDKNGIIRYIAREYDPATMESVIQELLAEP